MKTTEHENAERLASAVLDRHDADPDDDLAILARQFNRANERAVVLRRALEASVKLQSHYAELLNMRDGGKRTIFANADAWVMRLLSLDK